MKKLTAIFLFALVGALIYGTAVSALVINGDFETGAFGAWAKSTYINNGFSQPLGSGGSDLSAILGGPAVSPLSLSDARTNNVVKFPAYGHYSARVNSDQSYTSGGYAKNGNAITQNIPAYIDPTDNKAHIKFTYAAIMVNPTSSAHTPEQKPYFRVRAINTSNGNDVLYDFQSYVSEPGKNWQNGASFGGGEYWQYLDWTLIDLTPTPAHPVNPGDVVQVVVSAAGCSLGGHPGYVYVDEITDNDIAGPTVLATAPASVTSGSAITYTYNYRNGSGSTINPTITSTQPTGVTFTSVSDNTHCNLSGGTVTCNFTNVAALATGSFTITGTVTAANGTQIAHGNYNIAATGFPTVGGQTALTNVTNNTTTTTVSGSPNPSVFGQNVTFTANVTPNSGSGTPTGTIQFVVDGSNFGFPVAMSGGSAQTSTASLSVGAGHTVTANYSGDGSFQASSGSLSGGQTVNKANSTVSVAAAPNPAVAGQPITLTANVGAAVPGAGTPTGPVTFFVDGNPVCTAVPLAGGQATCNVPGLTSGNHTVSVSYGGDGNFNGGNGTLVGGVNVNKANVTVGVSASPNPSVAGQPVTFTANVAPVAPGSGTPTGTVTFYVDGNPVCTNVPLAGGLATCLAASLPPGNHVVTVTYSGDPNFNGGGGTLTGGATVNKADTTLALTSAPNPSVAGQPVTATANVAPVAPGSGTPTGPVTFYLDGNPFCTNVPLAAASAACNLGPLGAGNHVVTAIYTGDSSFNGSNGTVSGGQTVNKANTTTTVSASPNPSVTGEPVTFTATVGAVAPGTGTPTGTMTFFIDGNAVCSNVALSGLSATCGSALGSGSYAVTATYNGDGNFNTSSGSVAGGLSVNKANTTTTVSASPNPSVAGQPVTFTATVGVVAPGAGTPTGTITFFVDGNAICTNVAMSGLSATCGNSLGAGNYVVTATYNGDSNFNGSNGTLSGGMTVNKADTTTNVSSTVNPSVVGQSVTFTANVTPVAPGSGTATGTATFSVDGNPLCSNVALSGGSASCMTSALNAGNHPVSVTYNGDVNFNTSNGSLNGGQTVNPADTTLTLAASPTSSVSGQSVTFTASIGVVAPGAGSPSGTVTFYENGNPICSNAAVASAQAACSTSTLANGGHVITATYSGEPNFNGSNGTLAGGFTVGKANTTTTLTASLNPSTYGQPVTFTASVAPVAPGVGTPTGTVSFNFDGNILCANVALASAQGTCTVSTLPAGSSVVVAIYDGDNSFYGSAGSLSGGPLTINKADTSTVITNSAELATPTHVGEAYQVHWSVTIVAPGAGTLTGSVTASDGTASCSAPVAAGGCSLTSNTPGQKTITAVYSGDANFNGSSAPSVPHTVNVMISGRVMQYQSGGPNTAMPGVSVTLSGSASNTTTTDANGYFTFSNLAGGGSFVVSPASAAKTFDPTQRTISNLNNNAMNVNFVGYDSQAMPRELRIVNQYVVPGEDAVMPFVLESRGNEAGLTFSIDFDANPLKSPDVTCGADAPGCGINVNNGDPGHLGVTVNFATPMAVGSREAVKVTFHTHATITSSNSLITFTDAPTVRATWDADENPLPTNYKDGAVVFSRGLESDVAGRSTGDGKLESNDVTMVRQFVVGNVTPDPMFNEFQRADAAPAVTKGDGQLDATDIVQARRFTAGLDPSVSPGGPYRPGTLPVELASSSTSGRELRVGSATAANGTRVTLPVELTARGDEVALSFTVNFDPMKLRDPQVSMADGTDAALTVNTNSPGRATVLVDSTHALSYSKGAGQLLLISFDVAQTAASGDAFVTFGSDPTPSVISDANGQSLSTAFSDGKITITGPNAQGVEVSGRVLTPDGRGVRNAQVSLIDTNGVTRTVTTGTFGYYRFDGVAAGESFTLQVTSRRYRFEPRMIRPTSDLSDVDLIGNE